MRFDYTSSYSNNLIGELIHFSVGLKVPNVKQSKLTYNGFPEKKKMETHEMLKHFG